MTHKEWKVVFHAEFEPEFDAFVPAVQDEILKLALLLQHEGPHLGRPHADTLKGSRHGNMKELRAAADNGAWRIAFAFDPKRQAILLVAGDKAGVSGKRFYRTLIAKADARFEQILKGG